MMIKRFLNWVTSLFYNRDKNLRKKYPANVEASKEFYEACNNSQIVYNAIQTPDGTILHSTHVHDYKTHVDKNGETYMVDGGNHYLRRNADHIEPYKELTVYLGDGHEKVRKVLCRGGRGKNGDEPLKWVPVCEMSDEWVKNTITYNEERSMGNNWFTEVMREDLNYRKLNNISIPD